MARDVAGSNQPSKAALLIGLTVLATAAALALGGQVASLLVGEGPETLAADGPGMIVAAALLGVWLALGTPYAFVAGQVGLVAGLDGGPATTPITQSMLIGVLFLNAAAAREPADALATFIVAATSAVALFGLLQYLNGVLVAGGALLVATAFAVYTLHRYERLALDLAGDTS